MEYCDVLSCAAIFWINLLQIGCYNAYAMINYGIRFGWCYINCVSIPQADEYKSQRIYQPNQYIRDWYDL